MGIGTNDRSRHETGESRKAGFIRRHSVARRLIAGRAGVGSNPRFRLRRLQCKRGTASVPLRICIPRPERSPYTASSRAICACNGFSAG